jgi:hypothetical protein
MNQFVAQMQAQQRLRMQADKMLQIKKSGVSLKRKSLCRAMP